MKKFFLIALTLVGFIGVSNAQEAREIAGSKGKSELTNSKSNGVYTFTMPSGVTKEDVEKNAKYYTHYFTISYDESSKTATVNMVNNQAKNRLVIARFLTACGLRYVNVDNSMISIDEFIKTYLE